MAGEMRAALGWILTAIVFLLVAVAFAALSMRDAKAGEFRSDEQANPALCRGWIDISCSCSHRACWTPRQGEFKSLGDGRWRETSSGKVKQQTGWSQDGTFVVCAWSTGTEPGVSYHVGRGNRISCLYPPLPAF